MKLKEFCLYIFVYLIEIKSFKIYKLIAIIVHVYRFMSTCKYILDENFCLYPFYYHINLSIIYKYLSLELIALTIETNFYISS